MLTRQSDYELTNKYLALGIQHCAQRTILKLIKLLNETYKNTV